LYPEGRASLTDAYGLRADPQLYNSDLAPTTDEQRRWSTYNYIALWFSMSMEDDVHAGVEPDRRRHELEAGHRDDPAGQPDRAGPNGSERARRGEVRHSLPCICSRIVRRQGREYSRDPARAGCLRMVRHSVVDRR